MLNFLTTYWDSVLVVVILIIGLIVLVKKGYGYYAKQILFYLVTKAEAEFGGGTGTNSIIEGIGTIAIGDYSHAEGNKSIAVNQESHAEGYNTLAMNYTYTSSIASFDNAAKTLTLADGRGIYFTVGTKVAGIRFPNSSPTTAENNFIAVITAKDVDTVTLDTTEILDATIKVLVVMATSDLVNSSHSEGFRSVALNAATHAEGEYTYASGFASHAEGSWTIANGDASHAEGADTTASGYISHAEGQLSTASGDESHAEGYDTTASGKYSHAEGYKSISSGNYSHAQGRYTTAQGYGQMAIGKYNIVQGTVDSTSVNDFALIIGNGTSTSARGNALTCTWDGVVQFAGAPTVLQTASYTLALTDKGTMQKCLSASAIVVTIPLNDSVVFPINTEITIVRYGAGTVSIAPISGVTLYSSDSKKSVNKQYEAVTLKKIATDEWLLIGSLSA